MLSLFWNLSAAIRGYLRFYMPTNRAVDWLRSPSGLNWAIPAAIVATPAYLGAMALCVQFAVRPGLGWLNLLVLLFFWNATKFAWLAALAPFTALRRREPTTADHRRNPRDFAVLGIVSPFALLARRLKRAQ